MRIGLGIDYHCFELGEGLWLGGVAIPYHKRCKAHSDGDVLLHALCDALLGALALGDIGQHFPNTDRRYCNISSLTLLQRTCALISNKGYVIVNIDSMIMLEEPKIGDYIPLMQEKISTELNIPADHIGIKATTTEMMGFIGRKEGIMAQAIVLVDVKNNWREQG